MSFLIMNTLNDKWTFGITSFDITLSDLTGLDIVKNERLHACIQSIKSLNILNENYEIIVIGGNTLGKDVTIDGVQYIHFDESIKPAWITKKKNLLIERAQFENIILIHDYVSFDENWYNGFISFTTDWDVCMCKIRNKDNTRWRDWLLWWCDKTPYRIEENGTLLAPNRVMYDDTNYINNGQMYISGTVIIGKKTYLQQNKLNEDLCWGQGEDCEWSGRCNKTWNYKMNTGSTLRLLKQHQTAIDV